MSAYHFKYQDFDYFAICLCGIWMYKIFKERRKTKSLQTLKCAIQNCVELLWCQLKCLQKRPYCRIISFLKSMHPVHISDSIHLKSRLRFFPVSNFNDIWFHCSIENWFGLSKLECSSIIPRLQVLIFGLIGLNQGVSLIRLLFQVQIVHFKSCWCQLPIRECQKDI